MQNWKSKYHFYSASLFGKIGVLSPNFVSFAPQNEQTAQSKESLKSKSQQIMSFSPEQKKKILRPLLHSQIWHWQENPGSLLTQEKTFFSPWMDGRKKAALGDLLRELGVAYGVIMDIQEVFCLIF